MVEFHESFRCLHRVFSDKVSGSVGRVTSLKLDMLLMKFVNTVLRILVDVIEFVITREYVYNQYRV